MKRVTKKEEIYPSSVLSFIFSLITLLPYLIFYGIIHQIPGYKIFLYAFIRIPLKVINLIFKFSFFIALITLGLGIFSIYKWIREKRRDIMYAVICIFVSLLTILFYYKWFSMKNF